jgi:branched-subunit amino acid aminotransferase/4-amino-4-deoxychorismate lyase
MSDLRLYALTDQGVQRLAVPASATDFLDLYAGLKLGSYSALRTFEHNKFLHLAWHIERTKLSLALLGMPYDWDEARFRGALHEVVSDYPAANARVRFDILAEPVNSAGVVSQELIALKPFEPVPEACYEEGVGVEYARNLQREMARAKTAEFARQRSHLQPGRRQERYEYLIVDNEGYILEGTMTNFWAARDGVVYTAGEEILEGITRKIILSLLPKLGIPVRLQAVHQDAVAELDEAAISGSSRAVVPVVRIGDVPVGEGRPGPVFRRILTAYEDYVAGAVRTAVNGLG